METTQNKLYLSTKFDTKLSPNKGLLIRFLDLFDL